MAINTTIPNIIGGEIRALPLNQDLNWTLNNLVDLQAQISANDVDIANRYTKAEVDTKDANLQSQVTVNKNTMDNHVASTTAHDANNIVLTSEDPYLTANNVESGLEQVSSRVSTIIAQSGTSSTEVVDARISSTYGVFTTLGNRLNSSDIKLKALEDEVETQNIGTLSLTGTTSNQSPTDTYSGIVDVEIGGATLNQTVVNGNFANGTTGWLPAASTHSIINNVLSNIGDGTSSVPVEDSQHMIFTGKTLIKTRVRATSTAVSLSLIVRDITNNITTTLQEVINPVAGQWYTLSGFFTTSIASTNRRIRMQHAYSSSATANGKVMEIEGDDTKGGGVFAIPLTGTPYESYTADQINAMIPTYFEGLKSTEQVEVDTSGVQLFDGKIDTGSFSGLVGNLETEVVSTVRVRSRNYTNVKSSQAYTMNFLNNLSKISNMLVKQYDKNGIVLSDSGWFGVPYTFTTLSNAKTVRFLFRTSDSGAVTYENFYDIILSEGLTALPYQPHKPSQLSVTCTNPSKFELSKLPNLTQNEVNQVKGFPSAVKRIGRIVIDGSGSWTLRHTGGDFVAYYSDNILTPAGIDATTLNSKAVGVQGEYSVLDMFNNNPTAVKQYYVRNLRFYVSIPLGQTPATYLAANPIVLYYTYTTPVFIPYEDFNTYGIEFNGLLTSQDDYTNINYTADLVPIVNLEYPRNLGACVDGLSQSMGNIYDIVTQTEIDLQTKKQKNYIINGGFDIWQRGILQTANDYGSDDRWYNTNIGSTKVHSQQIFALGQSDVPNNPIYFSRTVVSSVVGVSNYVNKTQRLEGVSVLAGKTVSLSFFAKADANKNISVDFAQFFGSGGSTTIEGIGSQKIALTTSWQKITLTVNIPTVSGKIITSGNYLSCVFWFDAGSNYNTRTNSLGQQSGTFDISSVCLVEGSNPQDYQSETVVDVKRQCERYLFDLSGTYRMGYVQSNYLGFAIPSLLTKMRANPIVYNAMAVESTDYQVYTTNGAGVNGFTLSLPTPSEIRATKTAHGITDGMLGIFAKIFADAEL